MDENKLPIDDERYRIPGTNMFNFSKWSRENDPKPPAQYKVGDHVVLVTDAEVLRVFEDCDGTPLYELDHGGRGWGDNNVLPGHEDDWQLDGAEDKARAALARMGQPDIPALLAHADALAARVAELEAALGALVDAEPLLAKHDGWLPYVESYEEERWCNYCYLGNDALIWHHGEPERHAPDCPIAAARRALEGGA